MLQINNYPTICEDLKPCPFCGATPMWVMQGNEHKRNRSIIVMCGTCGAKQTTGAVHQTTEWLMEKAVEKGNRRIKE